MITSTPNRLEDEGKEYQNLNLYICIYICMHLGKISGTNSAIFNLLMNGSKHL